MEFLRRVIGQIKGQLKGLKTSEKLVLFLLLVIMGGAIYWMAQYSAQREMVPLLDQSFSETARLRIIQRLKGWNEEYEVRGDRIFVPVSRRDDLVSLLAYEELLPEDTSAGFSSMLQEKGNIWMPESERSNRNKIYLQMELARAIARFPGIDKADVFLNVDDKLTINRIGPAASASVRVETNSRVASKRKLASTIAALVGGANKNMRREDVQVIIDEQLVPVTPKGDAAMDDFIERKIFLDNYFRENIMKILPKGLDIMVGVNVELNSAKTTTKTRTAADEGKGTVVVPIETTSRERTNTSTDEQQAPGIGANVSGAVAGGGTKRQETEEETVSKREVIEGVTEKFEDTIRGTISKITATVLYPLSYFESFAQKESGSTDAPAPEAVQQIKDQEVAKITQMVMGVIGTAGEGPEFEKQVVVDSYWIPGATSEGPGLPPTERAETIPEGGSTFINIAQHYGKHAAVFALAMISLFMVLMMVRKASHPVDITEQSGSEMVRGPRPLDALGMEEGNIVDGEGAGGLLAGVELDEDAVHSRQVLEQVRDMIAEEPQVGANLIANWLKQDE